MSGNRRRAHDPTAAAGGGGRRAQSSRRRVDLLVGMALLLPVVVAAGLAVIGDESDPALGTMPPVETELGAATLVCPPALSDAEGVEQGDVLALRVPGVAGGSVAVRSGRSELAEDGSVEVGAEPV